MVRLQWPWIARIGHELDARKRRRHLLEQLKPFRSDSGLRAREAGHAAAGMSEGLNKALRYRLIDHEEDNRHGLSRPLQRHQRASGAGEQDIRLEIEQFRYRGPCPLGACDTPSKVNAKVAVHRPSVLLKALPQKSRI